jgi:hypothetical protein
MFNFRPRLPISDDDRQWVDQAFVRLEELFTRERLLQVEVILPTDQFFPDPYDRSQAAVESLFQRLCRYMQVDRATMDLELFPDETEGLRALLPVWESRGESHAAGYYIPGQSPSPQAPPRCTIAVRSTQLKNPTTLVATLAHELGHVLLIDQGRIDPQSTPDHEPLTDLLTVFLGLGVFTANSAVHFEQHQEANRQGWSMKTHGYLPERVLAYALALFAYRRKESKTPWTQFLTTDVRTYFNQSTRWLNQLPG